MDSEVGSVCGVKSLYNHSPGRRPQAWSEFKDPIAEANRVRSLGETFAVVRRYAKAKNGKETSWQVHSVEIKSPRLQKFLDDILHDYYGWKSDADPYTFLPPFKPIIHRWEKIQEAIKQHADDPIFSAELQLLRREFEPLIEARLSALKQAKATGLVSFYSLWMAYAPGDVMLSCDDGNLCAAKLVRMTLVEPPCEDESEDDEEEINEVKLSKSFWLLQVKFLDWNGSHCGFAKAEIKIWGFKEQLLAARLSACPLEMYPDKASVQAGLIARGRRFAELRGFHVVSCSTKKFVEVPPKGDIVAKPVSGRVVVDAFAYYKCQDRVEPTLQRDESNDETASSSSSSDTDSQSQHPNQSHDREEDIRPLTSAECLITAPRIKGFDLKNKEWCEFNVDDIGDTTWLDTPFDNLVLPEGEKDLVFAFASHPRLHKNGFDDFVEQKGQGITILLCGPPGVGKTLTSEAVAEKSRVPLYILTAGDLGTNPEKVEKTLDNALECCRLWDAVLLLDEADVFLETRNSDSLARNELTSIFLRKLEYYRGLMFLTTNRIHSIDPAFKSRLDLILPYYGLDEKARRMVWVNFVEQLGAEAASISAAEFDELAKVELNGREIKNSVKTALVLAAGKGPLKMAHIHIVLNIRERVKNFELNDKHST